MKYTQQQYHDRIELRRHLIGPNHKSSHRMTYHGKISNGQVVIDGAVDLPEGAAVTVIVSQATAGEQNSVAEPTLLERLKHFVGSAKNLPPDASVNVDHYLYGLPKK